MANPECPECKSLRVESYCLLKWDCPRCGRQTLADSVEAEIEALRAQLEWITGEPPKDGKWRQATCDLEPLWSGVSKYRDVFRIKWIYPCWRFENLNTESYSPKILAHRPAPEPWKGSGE